MLPTTVRDYLARLLASQLLFVEQQELPEVKLQSRPTDAVMPPYWAAKQRSNRTVMAVRHGRAWAVLSPPPRKQSVLSIVGVDGSRAQVTYERKDGYGMGLLSAVAVTSRGMGGEHDQREQMLVGLWTVVDESGQGAKNATNAPGPMFLLEMKAALMAAEHNPDAIIALDGSWIVSATQHNASFIGGTWEDIIKSLDAAPLNTYVLQQGQPPRWEQTNGIQGASPDDVRRVADKARLVCVVSNPGSHLLRPYVAAAQCTQAEMRCEACPFFEHGRPTDDAPCLLGDATRDSALMRIAGLHHLNSPPPKVLVSAPILHLREGFSEVVTFYAVGSGRGVHVNAVRWLPPSQSAAAQAILRYSGMMDDTGELPPYTTEDEASAIWDEVAPIVRSLVWSAILSGGHVAELQLADRLARIEFRDVSALKGMARRHLSHNSKEAAKR